MRFLGRNPWQKCKILLLAAVLLHVVQLVWVYFHGSQDDAKRAQLSNQQTEIAMEHLRNNLQRAHDLRAQENASFVLKAANKLVETIEQKHHEETNSHDSVCSPLVPYKHIWPDTISTFDVPDVANYSLDEVGRYFLPRKEAKQKQKDTANVVHVTLVPFSHSDPGYGMTMEGYYQSFTKNVLNLMVNKLSIYRNMTFQWAETVFLERWFRDITPATKEQVKDLLKRGQLEIVLGGWVMPDEAVTTFEPVIDQLIEGHQWVTENLGIVPENAWVNDPFGYSSTMPYLWKASGIENMVILRIHQAIKSYLMSKGSLEFKWRPYWERTSGSDILCNLMAYEGYWTSNVCGPKESVCKLFNFLHLDRFDSATKRVDSSNINQLAQTLYEQYRFTASLYKYDNLVIFLGEDNSYNTDKSWDDTYENYEKIIQSINTNPAMKMQIEFGTLKTYFKRLRKTEKSVSLQSRSESFPVLSGDFFPYSDWENAYWTGYFTTRPWLKRFSRELGSVLRSANIFSVIAFELCVVSAMCSKDTGTSVFSSLNNELRTARRELGMFQHHDGITGTSLPFVVQDYETRLTKGYESAYKALKLALVTIQTKGKVQTTEALILSSPRKGTQQWIQDDEYSLQNGKLTLLVINPIERMRTDVVRIRIRSKNLRITLLENPDIHIPYQVTVPATQQRGQVDEGLFVISFVHVFKPLLTQTVVIEETTEPTLRTETQEFFVALTDSDVFIENVNMKAVFSVHTGMLTSVTDSSGRETKFNTGFMKYVSKTSGAYLFGPEGPAEPLNELNSKPSLLVTKGPVYSELKTVYSTGFTQTVSLYNISGERSMGIHVHNVIKLSPSVSNSEIIWRFKTDIKNGQMFFTDQNGYQFLGRKTYPDRLTESNFYPATTMVFIEDDVKRMAVHMAQPAGVASLKSGWIEVMLDRTMMFDDQRGLGMGVPDKVLTVSQFVIQVEHKEKPGKPVEERYNYVSARNILINEQLQNPLHVFTFTGKVDSTNHKSFSSDISLPCDTSVVGLRHLVTNDLKFNGTSLILHRKSLSCDFKQVSETCDMKGSKVTFNDLNFGLVSVSLKDRTVVETSLSHLHRKRSVKLDEDIRPDKQGLRSFVIQYKDHAL